MSITCFRTPEFVPLRVSDEAFGALANRLCWPAQAALETARRWAIATPQWPIMSAVLHGVSRDAMMACHKANHIQVAYAHDAASVDEALLAKAECFAAMGLEVALCGIDPRVANSIK